MRIILVKVEDSIDDFRGKKYCIKNICFINMWVNKYRKRGFIVYEMNYFFLV